MIRQLEAEGRAEASAQQTPYHWAAAYVLMALALAGTAPIRHTASPATARSVDFRLEDRASRVEHIWTARPVADITLVTAHDASLRRALQDRHFIAALV